MRDKQPLCDQPKWRNLRHRCSCVFDLDTCEPISECLYHERIRHSSTVQAEEIERLRGLVDEYAAKYGATLGDWMRLRDLLGEARGAMCDCTLRAVEDNAGLAEAEAEAVNGDSAEASPK